MVDPKIMCMKHLLGEHVETHMFTGTIKKGVSVKGYLEKGLLEPENLFSRHQELVSEMISRGMNHNSPLERVGIDGLNGMIDKDKSLRDLTNRCEECKRRQQK